MIRAGTQPARPETNQPPCRELPSRPQPDPNASVLPLFTSAQPALCLSPSLSNIASMRHRHRRPTARLPLAPHHRADLSGPPARQPPRPYLSIAQLLPPSRRHGPHLRPVLLSSRYARLQSEPPWGHEPLHGIINGCAPRVKRCVLKYSMPSRQDLNDLDRCPALVMGLVVSRSR